jgi:polar amino acid transport system substrate-binding protein
LVEIAWDGIIPALQSDKIDVIFDSMTITDERKKTINFSDPYYSTVPAFIGQKGEKIELTKDFMKGKSIGVQVSTTHANYVQQAFGDVADVRTYTTQDEADADLVAGRVDYVVADKVALDAFLKTDAAKDLGFLADVTANGPSLVGAGIRKDDTKLLGEFNEAIATLLRNGEYDRIAKPYFAFDIYGLPRK